MSEEMKKLLVVNFLENYNDIMFKVQEDNRIQLCDIVSELKK